MRPSVAYVLAIALCPTSIADAQPTEGGVDKTMSNAIRALASESCSGGRDDEIVVCGRNQNQFRIPKELRTRKQSSAAIRPGVALSANDLAPCGIFQGERRCSKPAAAQYGYGAGRDPITFITKVIDGIASSGK